MNSTGVLYSSSSSKYAELKNLLADLDRLFLLQQQSTKNRISYITILLYNVSAIS